MSGLTTRFGTAATRRAAQIAMLIVLSALCSSACAPRTGDDSEEREKMPQRSIEEVLSEYTPRWMSIPGVVGTGIGKCQDQPCIRVMVAKKTLELVDEIPSNVEGYIVDIVETGTFRPRPPA